MRCCGGAPNPFYVDCVPACVRAPPCPACGPQPVVCVKGPTGPASPYAPLVYFQAAMGASALSPPLAVVPLDVVTAGNQDLAFDAALGEFVAPALGFYSFSFAALLASALAVPQDAAVSLTVDGVALAVAAGTVAPGGFATLSGGALLQLLPGQRVALAVDGVGLTLQGPSTVGAPPYTTVLSGFSLF